MRWFKRLVVKFIEWFLINSNSEIRIGNGYTIFLLEDNAVKRWVKNEEILRRNADAIRVRAPKTVNYFPHKAFSRYECPKCNSSEGLFNNDERANEYCGNCGQWLNWNGCLDENPVLFSTRGFSENRTFLLQMRKHLETLSIDLEAERSRREKLENRNNPISISEGEEVCPKCWEAHGMTACVGYCTCCGQKLQVIKETNREEGSFSDDSRA